MDASDVSLGAVLSQNPVLYIRRKLEKHEKNLSKLEKESVGVKWALENLWYYLLERKFVLVTDHALLQWMARNKETNRRVTRWFLNLSF